MQNTHAMQWYTHACSYLYSRATARSLNCHDAIDQRGGGSTNRQISLQRTVKQFPRHPTMSVSTLMRSTPIMIGRRTIRPPAMEMAKLQLVLHMLTNHPLNHIHRPTTHADISPHRRHAPKVAARSMRRHLPAGGHHAPTTQPIVKCAPDAFEQNCCSEAVGAFGCFGLVDPAHAEHNIRFRRRMLTACLLINVVGLVFLLLSSLAISSSKGCCQRRP